MVNFAAISGQSMAVPGFGGRRSERAFSPDLPDVRQPGLLGGTDFFNAGNAGADPTALFSMLREMFMSLFGGSAPSFFDDFNPTDTAQGQASPFVPASSQNSPQGQVSVDGGNGVAPSGTSGGSIHRGNANAQGYVAASNGMPMVVPQGQELNNNITALYKGLPTDPKLYRAEPDVSNVRILMTGITMNNQCYDRRMWMALYQAGVPIEEAQRQGYLSAVNGQGSLHANFKQKGDNEGGWDISRPGNVYQLAEETLNDGSKRLVIYHWAGELPPGITREDVQNASFGDSPYPEYKGFQDQDYYHPLIITPGQNHQGQDVQDNWRSREAIQAASGYRENPVPSSSPSGNGARNASNDGGSGNLNGGNQSTGSAQGNNPPKPDKPTSAT